MSGRHIASWRRGDVTKERTTANSIDAYIAIFPQEVQARLREMRAIIREAAPDSSETISYAIPTFDLMGKHLVHFAAFKHHIGFYPTASGIAQFAQDFQLYKTSTGTVQFPFEQPLPGELITRIVRFRAAEIMASHRKSAVRGADRSIRTLQPNESDLPGVFAEQLPEVIRVLTSSSTVEDMCENLPDLGSHAHSRTE